MCNFYYLLQLINCQWLFINMLHFQTNYMFTERFRIERSQKYILWLLHNHRIHYINPSDELSQVLDYLYSILFWHLKIKKQKTDWPYWKRFFNRIIVFRQSIYNQSFRSLDCFFPIVTKITFFQLIKLAHLRFKHLHIDHLIFSNYDSTLISERFNCDLSIALLDYIRFIK